MFSEPSEWFDVPSILGRQTAAMLGLSKVPIVQLDDSHRPQILAHLLTLSETDRRLRFSYMLNDTAIAKYVDSIDFKRDWVFGIFGREHTLMGAVHLAALNPGASSKTPKGAELGLSLNAELRGHGLGTLLFQRALRRARNEGIEVLFIHTLKDNDAMLRIVRKLNMKVSTSYGQCEAHLRVKPASAGSIFREMVDEHMADMDYLFKSSMNRLKKWAEER